MGKLCFFTGTW